VPDLTADQATRDAEQTIEAAGIAGQLHADGIGIS